MSSGTLPLDGIRVVDCGRVIAAPYATQILADLGAEVIKVESIGGDQMRGQGTQLFSSPGEPPSGLTPHFLSANRNKLAIALDLSTSAGQQTVRDLVAVSNVFIENFKVGNLARFGLDWPSLQAVNPALVYCSITGFGQYGPYSERPATDGVFQALSGMMSITGEPGGPPCKIGVVITDVIAGIYMATAILAALRQREVLGGAGRHIDLALLDVAISVMSHQAVHYLSTGEVPQAEGSAAAGAAPAQAFALADGHMLIQAASDTGFAALCQILGCPELIGAEGFETALSRYQNRATLIPQLEARLARWTVADLGPRLHAAGIIAAPVYDLAETFADPQVRARGMVEEVAAPGGGTVALVASPLRASGLVRDSSTSPPRLDEHRDVVLRRVLGYDLEDRSA